MRRIWAALLLCLIASSPAAATAQTSGALTQPGWILLRVHHDEVTEAAISFVGGSSGAVGGVSIFEVDGGLVTTIMGGPTEGDVYVVVETGGVREEQRILADPAAPGTLQRRHAGPERDVYVLLWGVGQMQRIDWLVSATGDDAAIVVADHGVGGIYSQGRGFTSQSHLRANTPVGAAAHQQGGVLSFDVAAHFIGVIGFPLPRVVGEHDVTLETGGEVRACPCFPLDFIGTEAVHAGRATVRVDMTAVEAVSRSQLVAGVDVPWPPSV